MKKIMILLLASLLTVSSLAACSTEGDEGTTSEGGTSTATDDTEDDTAEGDDEGSADMGYGVYDSPEAVSEEIINPEIMLTTQEIFDNTTPAFQAMKTLTNIEFEVIAVPLASWNEKEATTLASGDLPDIFAARSYQTIDDYGPEGAFLSFEPYIEEGKMPNYIDVLSSYDPAMKLATSPDGNRYGAPRIYEAPRMDETLLSRLDILEDLGFDREIETMDEFLEILRAIKAEYPDSTPYVNRWGTTHVLSGFAGGMFNTSYTYDLVPGATEYVWGPESQNYKDLLTLLATMYEEGLINKDYATMVDAEWDEAWISDKAMFSWDYCVGDTLLSKGGSAITNPDFNVVSVTHPEYNGERALAGTLHGYYGYTKAIAADSEYADELIRWIDWTYAPEGQEALMFGVEGEHFQKNGDEYEMLIDIAYTGNPEGTIPDAGGFNDQDLFSVLPKVGMDFYEGVGDMKIDSVNWCEDNGLFVGFPQGARFYDDDVSADYNDIRTALNTYIEEESAKVINGETSVEDWDNVVQIAIEEFKAHEGLALLNQAYADTYAE